MPEKAEIFEPIGEKGKSFDFVMRNILNFPDSKINQLNAEPCKIDIRLGDCFKLLDKLPNNSIDMILTDPPYFIDKFQGEWDVDDIEKKTSKAITVKNLPVGMKFDPRQAIQFGEFFLKLSEKLLKVLKPGGFFVSFSQGRLYHRMVTASEDSGFLIKDMMVWHYTKQAQPKAFSMKHFIEKKYSSGKIDRKEADRLLNSVGNRKTPQLRPLLEPLMLAQKPLEGTFVDNWDNWGTGLIDTSIRLNGLFPSNVMHIEKPCKDKYNNHPTVKPTELLSHMIKVFSKPEDTILDPFLGSGSTAISCLETGRNMIGYEINKKFRNIASKRIKDREEVINERKQSVQ